MKKETYASLTGKTRAIVSRLPFGALWLSVPTGILAAAYLFFGFRLLFSLSAASLPYFCSPAVCFLGVTLLRKKINRTRPYDAFQLAPVGRHEPGKGKSMPSRHAASSVAILMALLFLSPSLPLTLLFVLLTLLICLLRIVSGQHYPSDVLAGALFSLAFSALLLPAFQAFSSCLPFLH